MKGLSTKSNTLFNNFSPALVPNSAAPATAPAGPPIAKPTMAPATALTALLIDHFLSHPKSLCKS